MWTGTAWAPVGGGLTDSVYALTVFDDDGPGPGLPRLYAGGAFVGGGPYGYSDLARLDGETWVAPGGLWLGTGGTPAVWGFAHFHDGRPETTFPALYVLGKFSRGVIDTQNIMRWNGERWWTLGSGIDGVARVATVYDADGDGPERPALYVAGFFQSVGSEEASRIAKWDGESWSPFGVGIGDIPGAATGSPRALCVHKDDTGPSPPSLFVGGNFTMAGGTQALSIARWLDGQWHPVGAGFRGTVLALCSFDEDGPGPGSARLFAGGTFTAQPGSPANYIARWDGQGWSSVGTGPSGVVSDLVVYDPDGAGPAEAALIAGGTFTTADGQTVNNIARWTGGGWAPLGTGVNGTVVSLAVFDVDGAGPAQPVLFVGGSFSQAGGQPANRIARWDGASWSPAGAGFSFVGPSAMTQFDDDGAGPMPPAMYAVGEFVASGGTPIRRIARFDGASWLPVGVGIGTNDSDDQAPALAAFDDGRGPMLIAAGRFLTAAGQAADSIVGWRQAAAATVVQGPVPVVVTSGQSLSLSVTAAGVPPPTLQWLRNGSQLFDDGRIGGSTTSMLRIEPATTTDAGIYRCQVQNPCGQAESQNVNVVVVCSADWDLNGRLEPADVGGFVLQWVASVQQQDLTGDFDNDGQVTPTDVAMFVLHWFTQIGNGC